MGLNALLPSPATRKSQRAPPRDNLILHPCQLLHDLLIPKIELPVAEEITR